jgi:F-type H+-transporting ATPase subunit epsilon
VSLDLEILVPDGIAVHTRVVSLRAADASGQFGVRPGHEAFLTMLAPCVLSFREEDGRERYAAADGGVLVVEKDHVSIVTREAVLADQLEEVANAAAAMLEARRLHERMARAEFAELQSSLLRELRLVEKRT